MAGTIYANHRENQKELILQVAEELFITMGIQQVTIGDIAKRSRLTRATIYRYFSNKEEMAAEIFKSVTRGWVERNEREVWNLGETGYETVERFVSSHFSYLFRNPKEARFIAEFNYLYAKQWPTEMVMQLFSETLDEERRRLIEAIRRGIEDGSLRADVDAELMLASVFNFNSGMMSRLGELGDKVENEFELSSEAIFMQVCRVFLDGLRAAGSLPPGRDPA